MCHYNRPPQFWLRTNKATTSTSVGHHYELVNVHFHFLLRDGLDTPRYKGHLGVVGKGEEMCVLEARIALGRVPILDGLLVYF